LRASRFHVGWFLALSFVAFPAVAGAQTGPEPPPLDSEDGKSASPRWWRSAYDASQRWIGELNEDGLYPQFKSFAENTGPALGLVYWRPRLGNSGLSFYASYAQSFRGDELREIRFGKIPHTGRRQPRRGDYEVLAPSEMGENGAFYYLSLRQRELGGRELYVPSTTGDAGSTIEYQNDDAQYDGVVGYRFSPHFSAAVRAGILTNDIGSSDGPLPEFTEDRVLMTSSSALTSQPDYFRAAAVLSWDDRDAARNPHSGSFVNLTVGRFADRGRGAFSFNRVTLDARRFQPLGSPRHILAVRLLTSLSFADEGARVPFYLQDTLGGPYTMRGYPSFRFQGDKLVSLSTEYRFELTSRFQLAAFYDAGKAWDDAGFGSNGLKGSYGVGFRLKSRDRVIGRIDVGRGAEGTQVHLKLGYSF
jgi:Omp85 superfamily domain